MIVIYGLSDGIVLTETGNVIKTRLDRRIATHEYMTANLTTSWMDLGNLKVIESIHGRSLY